MSLADQQCVPCRGGVPPLPAERANLLLVELGGGWTFNEQGHLEKAYSFPNFSEAMTFASRVAEIAESESHHPDLYIRWGQCRIEIWTHKIAGLTESDFYLAAKFDRAWTLPGEQ